MNLSVVIPCYRSSSTLTELVERLHGVLPDIAEAYEIVLVVDGSPDHTYALARQLGRHHPDTVRSVLLRRNYGQHNALLAGIARARHDVVITMDDDLQHRPEEIPTLLEPLSDPLIDLVYGVPVNEEHGFFRSLASRLVKRTLASAGVEHSRDLSAFRAFRADLRDGFAHAADIHGNVDVMLSWTTTGVTRAQVEMDKREQGRSGYSISALIRHAMNMFTGYGTMPLRAITWMGGTSAVVAFGLLLVVLWKYLSGEITVAGWTSLAALIAGLGGLQMLSMGILGEYLGRLHFRSTLRPNYLVRVDDWADGPRAGLPGALLPPSGRHEDPDEVAEAIQAKRGPRALPPGTPLNTHSDPETLNAP